MRKSLWAIALAAMVVASLMATERTAFAVRVVTSPYGSDRVIVMLSIPDHDTQTPAWNVFSAAGQVQSYTSGARVFYKNIQVGSPYYGACAVASLPSVLTEDLDIVGSNGADIFQPKYPVFCGSSYWQVASSFGAHVTAWQNSNLILWRGEGGDDLIEQQIKYDFTMVLGGSGSDRIISGWESPQIYGESGNDFIRATNSIFLHADRVLFGGSNDDCLESNNQTGPNNQGGQNWRALMGCESGNDTVASGPQQGADWPFGNPAGQLEDLPNCENHVSNHCLLKFQGLSCVVDTDCDSGGCRNGICVPQILFVVGNTTLSAADQKLFDDFSSMNFAGTAAGLALDFRVVIRKDSAALASDANGKSLVVISESVSSANVGTKFTATTTPVVSMEPALQGLLNMTGNTWGTHQGASTGTQINIASAVTPLDMLPLAGFPAGSTTVVSASSTINWGVPGASAGVLARVVGSSTRSTIYKYEKGATMFTGPSAPAKRAFFFAQQPTVLNQNTNGWRLFDALIRWAVAQ